MSDRLLHYHFPTDNRPKAKHSVYGVMAFICAVAAMLLVFAVNNRSFPEELYPLGVPGIIAMGGAAALGCVLAALEPTRKRTFFWLAVVLTAMIPLVNVAARAQFFGILFGP
jgi:4-amino-4-deoxy-L-arabinose transferase-like glycosyltransferase